MTYDDDDDDGQVVELAPAVCLFCGDVTRDGLYVFRANGDPLPACAACMGRAMRHGGRLSWRRSPN